MDDRKELKVRVSEEEYEHLRRVAFERKMKIQDCLLAGLQMWYGAEEKSESPWATLSKEEATFLRGVLAYFRDKPYTPEREAWVQALAMLAKRYGK